MKDATQINLSVMMDRQVVFFASSCLKQADWYFCVLLIYLQTICILTQSMSCQCHLLSSLTVSVYFLSIFSNFKWMGISYSNGIGPNLQMPVVETMLRVPELFLYKQIYPLTVFTYSRVQKSVPFLKNLQAISGGQTFA